jgi:hypothetical protein
MKAQILEMPKREREPEKEKEAEKATAWKRPPSYLLPDLLAGEIFINDGTI